MKLPVELARKEIVALEPCVHGGELTEGRVSNPSRIIDFSSSVNPLGPPAKAIAAIRANFWRLSFYPDRTSEGLRINIARAEGVDPGNVIVGNGSTELIWLFSRVFIESGDEALMPAPTFGEYETAVRAYGGKPRFLKLSWKDFRIKGDEFMNRATSRTKVFFLCNPNNPTGMKLEQNELEKILEGAERKDILILIDEGFMDFVDGGDRLSLVSAVSSFQHIFVLKSFAKFFGLAGIRVGYGMGSEELIELLHRAQVPWNVNCLAQVAAIAALTDSEYRNKTRKLIARERTRMMEDLAQIDGFKVYPSETNFILIDIRETGWTSTRLKEALLRHGILVRDCSSFRGLDKHFIRVAVRIREENEKLLNAIRVVLGA